MIEREKEKERDDDRERGRERESRTMNQVFAQQNIFFSFAKCALTKKSYDHLRTIFIERVP